MVLYPVYLLFQSGRLAGQQIRSAASRLMPLLEAVKDDDFDPEVGVPPLNSDAPLQNVLDVLNTLDLPILISPIALPRPKKSKGLPERKPPKLLSTGHGRAIDPVPPSSKQALLPLAQSVENLAAELAQPGILILSGEQRMASPRALGDRPRQDRHATSLDWVTVHDADNHPVYLAQTVRGFASLLATGNLVLVDTENQILDILTPDQQAMLHQRIVYEIAGYYRDHHLRLRSQEKSLKQRWQTLAAQTSPHGTHGHGAWRFLPPPKQTTTMALPVRLFRRLMEWMQTSPVAVSANVFQESTLVRSKHGSAMPPPMPDPQSQRAIAPGYNIPVRQPAWKKLLHPLGFSARDSMQLSDPNKPAIAFPASTNRYWFDPDHQGSLNGWLSANQLSQMRRQTETFLSMPSLPFRNRWMPNWNEPIQGSDSIMNSPVQSTESDESSGHQAPVHRVSSSEGTGHQHQNAVSSAGSRPQLEASLANSFQSKSHKTATGYETATAAEDALLSPAHRSSPHSWSPDEGGELVSSIDPADRDRAMSTTLVDTKATFVGYVKHPLEQVLEWIDLGMLWIEDLAAKAWGWVKQVLK